MIDYIKKEILKYIVTNIKSSTLDEDKLNLEMAKFDIDKNLKLQWYLELNDAGIINIPNLYNGIPYRMQSSDDCIEITLKGITSKYNRKNSNDMKQVPNMIYGAMSYINLPSFSITEYGRSWLTSDEKL
jgi:hypothetical protein